MISLGKYSKSVTALAGAALTLASQIWGPDNTWVTLALLVATTLGVYAIPNKGKPAA